MRRDGPRLHMGARHRRHPLRRRLLQQVGAALQRQEGPGTDPERPTRHAAVGGLTCQRGGPAAVGQGHRRARRRSLGRPDHP